MADPTRKRDRTEYAFFFEVAEQAIRKARDLQRTNFGRRSALCCKSLHDIGLAEDRLAEEIILRIIQEHFPDHSIYSEETGYIAKRYSFQWIIDPLDGTNNYLAGILTIPSL